MKFNVRGWVGRIHVGNNVFQRIYRNTINYYFYKIVKKNIHGLILLKWMQIKRTPSPQILLILPRWIMLEQCTMLKPLKPQKNNMTQWWTPTQRVTFFCLRTPFHIWRSQKVSKNSDVVSLIFVRVQFSGCVNQWTYLYKILVEIVCRC